MFQQATKNSRVAQFHAPVGSDTLPEAPTFHPDPQQFKDPLAYIQSIKAVGER